VYVVTLNTNITVFLLLSDDDDADDYTTQYVVSLVPSLQRKRNG